jgi:hypothetical protein
LDTTGLRVTFAILTNCIFYVCDGNGGNSGQKVFKNSCTRVHPYPRLTLSTPLRLCSTVPETASSFRKEKCFPCSRLPNSKEGEHKGAVVTQVGARHAVVGAGSWMNRPLRYAHCYTGLDLCIRIQSYEPCTEAGRAQINMHILAQQR